MFQMAHESLKDDRSETESTKFFKTCTFFREIIVSTSGNGKPLTTLAYPLGACTVLQKRRLNKLIYYEVSVMTYALRHLI